MAKAAPTKKRYTEDQKKEIIEFTQSIGRGGAKQAKDKYGVSYVTLQNWMKKSGKPSRNGKAPKPGKASQNGHSSISSNQMFLIKNIVKEIQTTEDLLESLKYKLAKAIA